MHNYLYVKFMLRYHAITECIILYVYIRILMCIACPKDTLIIVYAHLFLSNKRSKSVLIIVMYVYTFNCYHGNMQ